MIIPTITGTQQPWSMPYTPIPSVANLPFAQPTQLLRVHGMEGVNAYPLNSPNSMVALFDEDEDIFYIKRTDAANVVSVRKFRFEEIIDDKPTEKYVTIDEFNKFKEELLDGKQLIRRNTKSAKRAAEPDDESIVES